MLHFATDTTHTQRFASLGWLQNFGVHNGEIQFPHP